MNIYTKEVTFYKDGEQIKYNKLYCIAGGEIIPLRPVGKSDKQSAYYRRLIVKYINEEVTE